MECLVKYIGLHFADFGRGPNYDCWGLVRHFYKQEFGLDLPDLTGYESTKDFMKISRLFRAESHHWRKVQSPEYGDVIVFNIAGEPIHVGIVIDNLRMLHIQKNKNSCIEKFTGKRWYNRIEGFYRKS